MLDLAGIPCAPPTAAPPPAGHCRRLGIYNPEPMSSFFDAMVIGEGRRTIFDVIDAYEPGAPRRNKARSPRALGWLATIPGVYVPQLYEVRYNADGTVDTVTPYPNAEPEILKRVVTVLPPPVTNFIVPSSTSCTTAPPSRSCAAARAAAASARRA